MSAGDAHTPRVYLIRHGETAWSKSGNYTGKTDIPLLPEGEERVRQSARVVCGPGKLVDLEKVARVFVSPRARAQRTWEIWVEEGGGVGVGGGSDCVEVTEQIAEWDYGDYEGMLKKEIRDLRKERELDGEREWDIWRDGYDGGETAGQVAERLDGLIGMIREVHGPLMKKGGGDVVVVAHGHILRAFVKRWLGYDLGFPLSLMLEPGGVGCLSYQHGRIEEPAMVVGMSFPGKA